MRVWGCLSAAALAPVLAGACALMSGCSLVRDAATAAPTPLRALPVSDAAVETNVESSLSIVRTAAVSGGTVTPANTPGFVAGASDGPSATSFAQPSPAVTVLAVYNDASRDCLGIALLTAAPPAPVLGQTAPGTYYFVARATPPGGCVAATFAAGSAVPAGWPAGDPSSAGFPAS